MLKRFFPKQPDFFEELSKMANIACECAKELSTLSQDQPNIEKIAANISKLEHDADASFRASLQLLTDTFITPIEREHLHSLFLATDDVVDMIHAVAQRALAYRMTTFSPGIRELFKLTLESTSQLNELINRIDEIKEPAELHRVSREINRTGSRIEASVRTTLASLYESNLPIATMMKERDLVKMIQDVTDAAEKVTTIMEEVLLDQA